MSQPATVQGSEWDLKTFITVNHPFQVPGAVLHPNTKYVFKRLNGASGTNHVVQVFNEDQSELLTTFFGISDVRLEPADGTILTFMETAPGYPKPVHSWFYPGRTIGLEFIYSADERAQIAAHAPGAQTTIETAELITPEPTIEEMAIVEEPVLDEQVVQEEVIREKPVETMPEEVAPQEPEDAVDPAPAPEPAPVETEETLPETAGQLPLIGLIGLACLGLSKAISRKRQS